jgi:hypothetical protein
MSADLSTLDLATLNAAQGVIVAAIRNQCCQWEQESADAAADGRLSNAVMVQNWAFAAELLASKVSTEFSVLFGKALDTRFDDLTSATHRSTADQVLDALTLQVAATQEVPELVDA